MFRLICISILQVRPCSSEDEEICVQVAPADNQIVLGVDNFYEFDAVVSDDITQVQLYDYCLKDYVLHFFNGK